ncbi:MAG: hypothetical protein OXK78_09325 [Caldilineaceae bacterium]|nr:hypothetical protein [Caldilineaceae bacterium]
MDINTDELHEVLGHLSNSNRLMTEYAYKAFPEMKAEFVDLDTVSDLTVMFEMMLQSISNLTRVTEILSRHYKSG